MSEVKDAGIYELLLEAGKSITSEVELEKLVQRITDIATEMSGAQFGAFFYNVINQTGESYTLYTISGAPREAFSKFPMPRNTAIFNPTFSGLGTVRYDDVTQQEHYGKNEPYHGMPKGHLPVKSYLAVSVISPVTKEVIGGLFFGHSQPGVFTKRSEKLVEGIAAQAAIAMGNAKLFEEKKKTEETLKEQREQYRSIFQSTTDAMIIFDDGKVIEANIAAMEMLGYPADEIKNLEGKNIFQHSDQLFNALNSIIKSGRQFHGMGKISTRDGKVLDVRITGTHYLHKGHIHILLVIKKIEAAKQIEEALVKSEAFTQTITNISPVTLWMTNEKGDAIYFNQTWLELAGGQIEDHLGNGWLNVIIPKDRKVAETIFMSAFNEKKIFSQDFRIQCRDGIVRWCSAYGSPYYLTDGKFGGFAGSMADVTERKNAEAQLARQNTLITTITNNTFQALFLLDITQRCTFMNPAAEHLTGFKLEEVQEKPLHYYIHHTHPDGRHFPIEECAIDRALPARMQTTGEEVFIRKNGEFFPVVFVASPIYDNGVPKGTVVEVRDITEEKRIQEELRNKEKEAMAMLEQKVKERTTELEKTNFELIQFTSVASHDLKEPVRKVSIFSQRAKDLAKSFQNRQFHDYMDNIIKSSKRMAQLIDDLLNFARLSQVKADFQPVDLNVLIEHINDDLQLIITEKKASIVHCDLPTVQGVELQLGQVFQNLISNSLKFAHPDRHPVITVECHQEGDNHIITYTDNGIGFENEMSEKIFEIFERLHPRENYEGTGIGLAIVKKILAAHGGGISATGFPGKGARFDIRLPAVRTEATS